jgi:hypothetical protein
MPKPDRIPCTSDVRPVEVGPRGVSLLEEMIAFGPVHFSGMAITMPGQQKKIELNLTYWKLG